MIVNACMRSFSTVTTILSSTQSITEAEQAMHFKTWVYVTSFVHEGQ